MSCQNSLLSLMMVAKVVLLLSEGETSPDKMKMKRVQTKCVSNRTRQGNQGKMNAEKLFLSLSSLDICC